MTKTYIGTKIVAAWPQEKDGRAGFAVRYAGGYLSWCPEATFRAHYRPMAAEELELAKAYGTEPPIDTGAAEAPSPAADEPEAPEAAGGEPEPPAEAQ